MLDNDITTNKFNASRLFTASCFALITTAFAFAIRAGILESLAAQFGLDGEQLGYINMLVLGVGFPIATITGGILYNNLGPKKMMLIALVCHLMGILMTLGANGYAMLLVSSFLIGFGNGMVEASCNPLVAAMYDTNKTTMLNKFHVWFPGGIFIGALISQLFTGIGWGWQAQIAVMLVPTLIYAYLFWGQTFPHAEQAGQAPLSSNLAGMANGLFIFMAVCMILTANSELSTQQWVGPLLKASGAQPMLILALTTGLMAIGRYFAGPVVHRLNPTGILLGGAIFTFIGITLLSKTTGPMIYVAAVFFAVGVCYFWPTMLGFISEYIPKSGALGLSVIGGIGMFATGLAQPVVGRWIESGKEAAKSQGLSGDAEALVAGQAVLSYLSVLPAILIVAFGALWWWMRNRK